METSTKKVTRVTFSKESSAFKLISLLQELELVEAFNQEQDVVYIEREPTITMAIRRERYGVESLTILLEFAEDASDIFSSDLAMEAHQLVELLLHSFDFDPFVYRLAQLRKGYKVWINEFSIPPEHKEAYLLLNSAIEWRGIVNDDWPSYFSE